MQPLSPATALLLFTRTPREEALSKTFVSGRARHTQKQLARQFIGYVRKVSGKSGLPVFVISSDQQKGQTFGERLAHAFESVFAHGFEQVIAIGNDTLTLSTEELRQAAELLTEHQAVLGPTPRGGAYLIGLSRSLFDASRFARLDWESPRLFSQLTEFTETRAALAHILPPKSDVNDPSDFSLLLAALRTASQLYRSIRCLLACVKPPLQRRPLSSTPPLLIFLLPLRGPPTASAW
jgi:hypothetical protein